MNIPQLDQLAQVLTDAFKQTGVIAGPTCYFTRGGGTGTLVVPDSSVPRMVYLHEPNARQEHIAYLPPNPYILFQDGHPEYETIQCRTGRKYGSDQLEVLDCQTQAGRFGIGTMSPMEQYWNSAYWASLDQITILRPHPYTPTAINDLFCDGSFPYIVPSTGLLKIFLGGGSNGDLPAEIAALVGTGKQQLAMLYFDKELNEIHARTLTAVTPTNTPGTAAARAEFIYSDVEDFTVNAGTEIPIYAVYLYDGQTVMQNADLLFDLRPFLSGNSTASQQFLQDRIDVALTIPAKNQALYYGEVIIEAGGSITNYGRRFVIGEV